MGKIIISDNVSLDGVIQDPAGEEGFRLGGWAGRPAAREETAQVLLDEALGTQALLFGRRSYEFFATRWPSRTGALADRLNSLPKYVVSSTLQDPAWNNSTILAGDAVNEISKLKQQLDGVPCASQATGPSVTASSSSPTSASRDGPVQLGLSLLKRLQRAILLQRDHNRFDLTSADDHLMIGNLIAGGNGTLTHVRSIPRQVVSMTDPLTP
jgi:dihydrofolate reductase